MAKPSRTHTHPVKNGDSQATNQHFIRHQRNNPIPLHSTTNVILMNHRHDRGGSMLFRIPSVIIQASEPESRAMITYADVIQYSWMLDQVQHDKKNSQSMTLLPYHACPKSHILSPVILGLTPRIQKKNNAF